MLCTNTVRAPKGCITKHYYGLLISIEKQLTKRLLAPFLQTKL